MLTDRQDYSEKVGIMWMEISRGRCGSIVYKLEQFGMFQARRDKNACLLPRHLESSTFIA